MDARKDIAAGMNVYASDGRKLGKVMQTGEGWFLIEKGLFFPKDWYCEYAHVRDLRDGAVHLDASGDVLQSAEAGLPQRPAGAPKPAAATATTAASHPGGMRIPVAEERLEPRTVGRQTGEVEIRKEVTTGEATVKVPVRKEEVRVERVSAGGRDVRPGEASFQEGTTRVPVYEEEVEIAKRPIVREEVVVTKEGRTEEHRATEPVRREEIDVKRSGGLGGARSDDEPLDDPDLPRRR